MKNLSKHILILVLFFLGISFSNITAQYDAAESVNKKLKDLKGDVSKITIETEDGSVILMGKEAEYLYNKLKAHKRVHFISEGEMEHNGGDHKVIIMGDGSDKETIIIKKYGDKNIEWIEGDDDHTIIMKKMHGDAKMIKKEIEVEDEDGETVVKVTTTTDGEVEVETYTGEDAEKFLEKQKDGKVYKIKIEDDINWDIDADDDMMKKKVKVEVEDGGKKVNVTTYENGEKKVEVFEGDEADELIEKMKKEHDVDVIISEDEDGKVIKKKVIIKKEKDDDDERGDNDDDND